MDEILLSPASQIQPEDSVGPGNSKSHVSKLEIELLWTYYKHDFKEK
jgi:hypothetical protein